MEFAIVVVGVLSALAVDQWRDGRRDAELVSFYLEAIEDDLRGDSAQITRLTAIADSVKASASALEALIDTRDVPADEMALTIDVSWLLMRLGLAPRSAAFEDMRSSGNLRLIRDPELRNRLQNYSIAIARSAESILDDGRAVDRESFPAALILSPLFPGLRERLQSQAADADLLPGLMAPSDVVALLRHEPETMREWLRRRQLHAAYVIGEADFRLARQTLPILADVRNARAGRPLEAR